MGGGTVLQEFGQITDVDAGQGGTPLGSGTYTGLSSGLGSGFIATGKRMYTWQDHRMRAADWTARSPPAPRPHGSKHRTKIGQTGLTGRNLNRPKQIRF